MTSSHYEPESERGFDQGFDMGFRACLDQIALTGLTPTSESTVKEFIYVARRRLGFRPAPVHREEGEG